MRQAGRPGAGKGPRLGARTWFDMLILGLLLGVCIVIDSELAQRFGPPLFELVADIIITAREPASPATPQEPKTAVVMITDGGPGGEAMADRWPLPISDYKDFVQRAWCLGAKAVFLDVGFPRALKGEIEDFVHAVGSPSGTNCIPTVESGSAGPGMPVYLANQYDRALRAMTEPDTKGSDRPNPARPIAVSAFVRDENVYVAVDTENTETAACRIARDLGATTATSPCPASFEVRDTIWTPMAQDPFSEVPDDSPCLYRGEPLIPPKQPRNAARRWLETANVLFRYLAFGPRTDWVSCPPVLTLPWSAVLDHSDAAAVRGALKDRVVLVSAAIAGVSDWTQTSKHRDLPGVYVHALALEMLLPKAIGPPRRAESYARAIILAIGSVVVLLAHEVAAKILPVLNKIAPRVGLSNVRTRIPAGKVKQGSLAVSVAASLVVAILLAFIYAALEWKLTIFLADIFFFCSCNIKEIWCLDPVQLLARTIAHMKNRLGNG